MLFEPPKNYCDEFHRQDAVRREAEDHLNGQLANEGLLNGLNNSIDEGVNHQPRRRKRSNKHQ